MGHYRSYISCEFFDRLSPHIATIHAYVRLVTLKERKAIILMCRARRNPVYDRSKNTTLWRTTQALWKSLDSMKSLRKQVITALDWFIDTPVKSGFLLSLMISFPVMRNEADKIRTDMIVKEMVAMERSRKVGQISWSSIIEGVPSYKVNQNPHPRINSQVKQKIMVWASRLSSTRLYPHGGTKLLSIYSMNILAGQTGGNQIEFSSYDAERIYSMTGRKDDAPCELKQRWYGTQTVPRTYFAQGLTAYHSSKYLRNAFNQLADLFRNVNRHLRVLPQLILSESSDDELFVYDLTSFTSLFFEHREFLLSLAEAVDDTEIEYADSWAGLSHTTLGYLIREYVKHNVSDPSYCSLLLPWDQSLELSHGTAGFLGVYGNLITCTIPHGIILATLNDNFLSSWCAGDDAGIAMLRQRKEEWRQTVLLAGDFADDKVFVGSEPGAVALKRPVHFDRGIVVFRNNVIWPVFGALYGNEHLSGTDREKCVDRFCSSMISFLVSCRSIDLSYDDILFALELCSAMYRALGLPLTGWYPACSGYVPYRVTIPVMDIDAFSSDPLARLVTLYCRSSYTCTIREKLEVDKEDIRLEGVARGNMTQGLKWLCNIGYLHAVAEKETLYGDLALERALDDVRASADRTLVEPYVYTFSRIKSIPPSLLTAS